MLQILLGEVWNKGDIEEIFNVTTEKEKEKKTQNFEGSITTAHNYE